MEFTVNSEFWLKPVADPAWSVPAADRCAAGVGIVAGQDRRPGPNLSDTARAADRSGKGDRVAPIERLELHCR